MPWSPHDPLAGRAGHRGLDRSERESGARDGDGSWERGADAIDAQLNRSREGAGADGKPLLTISPRLPILMVQRPKLRSYRRSCSP